MTDLERDRPEAGELAELTIGEAADRCGVATSALRFYEDKGLISSWRTSGGQRRFSRDVLRRVAFIRAAQSVGLDLSEIRESLAELPEDRAPTKAEWEHFAQRWQPRLDRQIAMLEAIRDRLTACIGCGCQTLDACDVFNPGDQAAAKGPGAHYLLAGFED
jgi:MerR family redox-sensitive transcriptional activator SoxR